LSAVPHKRIEDLHARVWQFRAFMEQHKSDWVTPPPLDATDFALTESTEALDAMLRLNPLYARNNEKYMTREHELAQTAVMLFTALGPTLEMRRKYGYKGANTLRKLILDVALADSAKEDGLDYVWHGYCVAAICRIFDLVPDIENQVEEVIAQFIAKHIDPSIPLFKVTAGWVNSQGDVVWPSGTQEGGT
jgi:hypothetical protein